MAVVYNKGEIREETDGGQGRPFRWKFKKPFTRKTLKYKLQMATWSTDAPPPPPFQNCGFRPFFYETQ